MSIKSITTQILKKRIREKERDFSPIERSRDIRELHRRAVTAAKAKKKAWTQKDTADSVGISESAVRESIQHATAVDENLSLKDVPKKRVLKLYRDKIKSAKTEQKTEKEKEVVKEKRAALPLMKSPKSAEIEAIEEMIHELSLKISATNTKDAETWRRLHREMDYLTEQLREAQTAVEILGKKAEPARQVQPAAKRAKKEKIHRMRRLKEIYVDPLQHPRAHWDRRKSGKEKKSS